MIEKNDPRFDVVLDTSDPAFAEKLREAIGATPDERIEIVTPQFERTDGVRPVMSGVEFSNLAGYQAATLRALGCCPWDEPDEKGDSLWLFPAEWYGLIPEGFPITTINDEAKLFRRGETSNDCRFGCLPYGVIVRAEPNQ